MRMLPRRLFPPKPIPPEHLAIRRKLLRMSPEHLKLFVQACEAEERQAKRRAKQKQTGEE